MTEAEAKTLRDNGAKLYHHVRVTIMVAAQEALRRHNEDTAAVVHDVWSASGLDDLFHALNSYGYRQLIQSGWNPMRGDPSD